MNQNLFGGAVRVACVVLAHSFATSAMATNLACPADPSLLCAEASPWHRATELMLRFSDPHVGDSGRWRLAIEDPANVRISAQSRRAGKLNAGRIMLVSGRVMLTRGLALEKGYEVDVLNEPLLYYQLAAVLLDRAMPEGPGTFKEASVVGVEEAVRGIRMAAFGATGLIGAPWSASGLLERKDAGTVQFSFKLDFYFAPEESRRVITLQGAWKSVSPAPALPAGTSLRGWKVQAVDRGKLRSQTLAILDYRPRTVGELQAALRASAHAP